MSTRYLGQPFDLHGGGRDLIFPHHENEIAQSEGAFGQPLARYWVHNGFLNIDQEKMSKSVDNVYTIHEILRQVDPGTLRHYFLGSHYRSPMDFSFQGLEEAARSTDRIYETIDRVDRQWPGGDEAVADPASLDEFRKEMHDDFNTPRALALIFDEVRSINRLLDEKTGDAVPARAAALKAMCEALGVLQDPPKVFFRKKKDRWLQQHGLTHQQIERWIAERNQARKEKKWQEADRIRQQMQQEGIGLEDAQGGTVWKVK
jgi:cysteinyl-tRNA synthetase